MGNPLSLSRPFFRRDPLVLADLPPLEDVSDFAVASRGGKVHGTCSVCFDSGAMLSLDCQHTMCEECLDSQLSMRWPGSRMTFNYLNCGVCRAPLGHESIECRLRVHQELRSRAIGVAVQRFRRDGLSVELCRLLGKNATEAEEEAQAEGQMVVYSCTACSRPYCGGVATCADSIAPVDNLQCPECEWKVLRAPTDKRCTVHGPEFAIYKCDFCCSLAVWQCGQRHFCEPCHNGREPQRCPGIGLCPLGIPHPPNHLDRGSAAETHFVFGCAACHGCTDANDVYEGGSDFDDYDYDDYFYDSDCDVLEDVSRAWKFAREEARITARGRASVRQTRLAAKERRLLRSKQQRRQSSKCERRNTMKTVALLVPDFILL